MEAKIFNIDKTKIYIHMENKGLYLATETHIYVSYSSIFYIFSFFSYFAFFTLRLCVIVFTGSI